MFVPPYNRFDATPVWAVGAALRVVCGGPESIGPLGFQSTPQWRGESVYLPAYAPFYGRAAEVRPAVEHAIEARWGLWVPIVLHWGWEAEAGWDRVWRSSWRARADMQSPGSDFIDCRARRASSERSSIEGCASASRVWQSCTSGSRFPGGSEDVVIELLEMFPKAELFTSIYDPEPWPEIVTERPVHASYLNRIPGAKTHYPKLLPLHDSGLPRI